MTRKSDRGHWMPDLAPGKTTVGVCGVQGFVSMHLDTVECVDCLRIAAKVREINEEL